MKPAPFKLLRPHDLATVCAALDEYKDDGRLLAGGQSLVPTMNFRLAQPEVLIDLMSVTELNHITLNDDHLAIGTTAKQREVELDPVVRAEAPLLARALPLVGHVQNRNRGTIGGSIAHADPAAELPAVALALGASLRVVRSNGERVIHADDFVQGPFTTSLETGDVLVEVRIPRQPAVLVAIHEISRRHGDFAVAGIALAAAFSDDLRTISHSRVAAFGVTSHPVRLERVEEVLNGTTVDSITTTAAGRAASTAINDVTDDNMATASYRRDALGVLVARALVDIAHQADARRASQQ